MSWFFNSPKDIEEIRGVSDENLKFVHTSNLWLIAMARLMQAEGVDDQPLIDELYRRGRTGFEMKGEK